MTDNEGQAKIKKSAERKHEFEGNSIPNHKDWRAAAVRTTMVRPESGLPVATFTRQIHIYENNIIHCKELFELTSCSCSTV